jgi:hypothetical protein
MRLDLFKCNAPGPAASHPPAVLAFAPRRRGPLLGVRLGCASRRKQILLLPEWMQ